MCLKKFIFKLLSVVSQWFILYLIQENNNEYQV